MMDGKIYSRGFQYFLTGEIDWMNDDIRVMFLKPSYVPSLTTHWNETHVDSHEVDGAGYPNGGIPLINKTLVFVGNTVQLKANSLELLNCNFDMRYLAVYKKTLTDGKILIGYIDFGDYIFINNSDLQIVWSTNGIFAISN